MVIRVLAPEVVNQIAAGEVIERPWSVVKELVENSLDAGATAIRVELAQGGAELIRVTDDGAGFLAEDLPLAFVSHATSKLGSVHDLDHIGSLGFRGEALASIGSVARCAIRSRRPDAGAGHEIRCEGGALSPVRPAGGPVGTQIEVRDLFFNTPARRRFLRSAGAEKARIQEQLALLAMARLDVDFTLVGDGREVLRLPAGGTLGERVGRAFGRDLAQGLLPVDRAFGTLRVEGLVAQPDLARRDSRLECMYVNGRLVRENSAVHAIRQAYREHLMGGRIPVWFLCLRMPPDQVDVNVHPRKAEVRFVESRRVAGCLHETVREALLGRFGGAAAGEAGFGGGVTVDPQKPQARTGLPHLPADLFGRPGGSVLPSPAPASPLPVEVREPRGPSAPPAATPAAPDNPFRAVGGRFLQVHDLYLVLQGPDGLLVVDQHALHERVLYERLQRQHTAREAAVQRLLLPAVVEVTPSEKAWLLGAAEDLAAEGFLVADFGPGAIAVQGLPAVLGRIDPKKLIRELLDGDDDGAARPRAREAIVERFHSMACRGSVMSGDRLTDSEIAALLQEAATLEHPHNCPHGRPTVLTFTGAELERYFRRRC